MFNARKKEMQRNLGKKTYKMKTQVANKL